MSGTISGDRSDDFMERYHQRFNEITQQNQNKSVVVTSTESLSGSSANCTNFNNNGTLTTNQFYRRNTNEAQVQVENIPSTYNIMEGSTTYSGISDAFVFKKPLPTKKFSSSNPHIWRRLDIALKSLRAIDDMSTVKFSIKAFETIIHTVTHPPVQPADPVHLMDHISALIKEDYFSKKVPKSICGSSVMSDQSSCIDQYGGNSERSIRLDRPTGPLPVKDSRVILQNITQSAVQRAHYNRPAQEFINSTFNKTGSSFQSRQETTANSKAGSRSHTLSSSHQLHETFTGSTYNLFNDSEIAQRRDEAAARQKEYPNDTVIVNLKKTGRTTTKLAPSPALNCTKVGKKANETHSAMNKTSNKRLKKVSVPVKDKSTFEHNDKNMSLLNGTACGTSRSGRTLKPPIKFYKSQGEEPSYEDIDMSVLNESMTLRNRKVVGKKEAPPQKAAKTKTVTTSENEVSQSSATKKSRGRLAKTGKENVLTLDENAVTENTKKVKKTPSIPTVNRKVVKSTPAVKGKINNKKDDMNKDVEKPTKKPAQKRKSKESCEVITKKKKTEELNATTFIEEDIFGGMSYRKPTHQNLKVALSPSAALLSAKKAAGEAQGKATPPCKAISDLIANESMISTMSAAKEVPKQTEATKRLIKKMVKQNMNAPTHPKPKTQNKNKKEDTNLNDLIGSTKSTYSVSNPHGSATLSVFRGNEVDDSDFSDMEDNDEDLM